MIHRLKYMGGSNFGDALNPILYEFITGGRPKHISHDNGQNTDCVMMIGSIIDRAFSRTIVWGSGLAYFKKVLEQADFRAVRGPLTREALLLKGFFCPEVYGDPAVLMPCYYNPPVKKIYDLGVIPHIAETSSVQVDVPGAIKIPLYTNNPLDTLRTMLQCRHIISSSLHGLVIADAYNIPSKWVEFSDKVIGKGFKFRDYYQSFTNDQKPLDLRKNRTIRDLKVIEQTKLHNNQTLVQGLLKSCPI